MSPVKRLLVLAATLVTIVINAGANLVPYNGLLTAEVSNKYFNFFTPAGYVFIIWGVIYLGLIVYTLYHFLKRNRDAKWLEPAVPWFVIAGIANSLWMFAWHYEQLGVSVILMGILLVSLIKLYLVLEIGVYPASALTKWMVHVPISLYLGWISVATVANISAALTQVNWGGLGIYPEHWTLLLITIALVLAFLALKLRRDYVYALVILWAVVGIGVNMSGITDLVVGGAIVGSGILGVQMVLSYLGESRSK